MGLISVSGCSDNMAHLTADTERPSREMSSMFDNDQHIPDEVKSTGGRV